MMKTVLLAILVIGILIFPLSDASAKKIALQEGDWVKGTLFFEAKGEWAVMLMPSIVSIYEDPGSGCNFDNHDWFRTEVVDVSNEKPFFKTFIACNGVEHELKDLYLGVPLPFIPIDVKVGDVVRNTKDLGPEKVVSFEKIQVGSKSVDVIKTYSEKTIEEEEIEMIQAYSAYYEKNSGLLLKDRLVVDAGIIPFMGHTKFTFESFPSDYHIPSRTVEQTTDYGSGGCLIATATFGTELAPQVQQLRELRDNTLLKTQSGSAFISGFNELYYSFSPTIADLERESPIFKETVKLFITPMISSLSLLNYVGIDSEVEVLGYGISLILLNAGMYVVTPIGIGFFVIRKTRNSNVC